MIQPGPMGAVPPSQQEPSAVVSRRYLVVGYDDETAMSSMGWAISTNEGQSWTKCSADDLFCNGPIAFIGTAAVTSPSQFLRHPSLANDRFDDVVYVTLADTDGDRSTAERVIAVLSTDQGLTFTRAFPVNEGTCDGGSQDMPTATFDHTTTPPTLWIAWRNKTFSTFGGCIRRFFVDHTVSPPVITPLDAARGIAGMDRNSPDDSQGALKVQAGDGAVEVVYVNSDHIAACPDPNTRDLAWASVASYDNGASWLDNARMFHTSSFQQCIGAGTLNIQNSIRAFDFVRTPTGMSYVIVNDAGTSLRLFMSPAAGTKGWQNDGNTIVPWFEWCPGTLTQPTPPMGVVSPTWNWRYVKDGPCPVSAIPVSSSAIAAMFPSLTVDGNGRLAISYYEAHALPTPGLTIDFAAIKNPQDPFAALEQQTLATTNIPLPANTGFPTVAQPLGAYAGVIPKQGPTGLFEVGCSSDGKYFPFWVGGSSVGKAEIATGSVSLF